MAFQRTAFALAAPLALLLTFGHPSAGLAQQKDKGILSANRDGRYEISVNGLT